MSRYLSDTAARKLRSGKLPRRLTEPMGIAGALTQVLSRLLSEDHVTDRISVSRRVLMDALALARAVDEACKPESKP